jgi:hypothetical protein
MVGKLAYIMVLDDGPDMPGFGGGRPARPGDPDYGKPIFHPGHPDHGLPSSPGHPSQGLPIFHPGHPDHGLPSSPGHPSTGLPPDPARPDNSLPPGGEPIVINPPLPPPSGENANKIVVAIYVPGKGWTGKSYPMAQPK